MNSEELEQSLRAEFETHLKLVFADVQQEITSLQEQVEQGFERHKSQMSEAFESFAGRARSERGLDIGFRESVVEHLRLARDEGARITATAFAEAEEMAKESADADAANFVADAPAVPSAGIGELRDGINEICAQTSQAAILKSLVAHAGQFTPRGAFFIVKNEHLVGWRVFGRDEQAADADATVREIYFPVSNETVLGASVKSLSAVESSFGEHADDAMFLDKLEFNEPEKMVAIPLVARGRGVAVLYADKGANVDEINVEALETLVRVAGLTVEVLAAAAPNARPASAFDSAQKGVPVEPQKEDENVNYQAVAEPQQSEPEMTYGYAQPVEAAGESGYQPENSTDDYSAEESYQPEAAQPADAVSSDYAVAESLENDFEMPTVEAEKYQPVYEAEQTETESYSWNQPSESPVEKDSAETEKMDSDSSSGQYQFEDNQAAPSENQFESDSQTVKPTREFEPAEEYAAPSYEPAQEDSTPVVETNYGAYEPQDNSAETVSAVADYQAAPVEEVAEVVAPASKPTRSRFSDKNIDLPVEVSEDERRLHNDARRFARLLVSEIKLYNEQKVKEGRDGSDLYERLREAIDRSREMYDKRVQPPVAAKFDYFHYELVNSLADGDQTKLGESYASATV